MVQRRIGERIVVRIRVELNMRIGMIGMMKSRLMGRRTSFSLSGKIENRRRRNRHGIIQILIEEAVQGEANSFEGVSVGEMSFRESVAVVDCVVEEGTPLMAERHRRKFIMLRACTTHYYNKQDGYN